MDTNPLALLPLFRTARLGNAPLALATVIGTEGSTYRKAGAHMLLADDGSYVGLLSGGCLEGDLAERAREVIADGRTRIVTYDMRGPDDLLWGLGVGCEGAMRIALSRVSAAECWQPLAGLFERIDRRESGAYAIALPAAGASEAAEAAASSKWFPAAPAAATHNPLAAAAARVVATSQPELVAGSGNRCAWLICPVPLPTCLLVLGGGPDAVPVTEFGAMLGWQISVADHRAANIRAERFPRAHELHCIDADTVAQQLDLNRFDGLVIMSHHLPSDEHYLRAAARSTVPYVGLLGPKHRREKLLADLGPLAKQLRGRLRAPIGLDLGAATPETIALAIVAEMQAIKNGRSGIHLSAQAD